MAKEEYNNKLLDIYTEKNAKNKKIIDDEPVSDVLIILNITSTFR